MFVSRLSKILYGGFLLLVLFVALNSTAQPAYGYVDPGSGLVALQVVGSTIAALGFLLRKRVREFLGRFQKNTRSSSE